MEEKEKIKIAYFYIEGNRIYAVEDVAGFKKEGEVFIDMPPRIFSLEGRDEFGNNTGIEVIEIDYR